mmetsp:Transcript_21763/g.53343  ORF Transcript_21763/g.53343 Transcript_21763/m.53343 type:complete len:80 (+) Transcript_21763:301-540(+)
MRSCPDNSTAVHPKCSGIELTQNSTMAMDMFKSECKHSNPKVSMAVVDQRVVNAYLGCQQQPLHQHVRSRTRRKKRREH